MKKKKTCVRGHIYFRSSDCPVCPVCESERKPDSGFLSVLSAPARRALERENIKTVKALSLKSQEEIIGLHGIGPSSLPRLIQALKSAGLQFRQKDGS